MADRLYRSRTDRVLFGVAGGGDDLTAHRHFDGIPVAVQMTAQAGVIGDAVAGVEFEPAGDAHCGPGRKAGREL